MEWRPTFVIAPKVDALEAETGISPDVPRIFGAKPDARPVVQPQPAALRLLLWHL